MFLFYFIYFTYLFIYLFFYQLIVLLVAASFSTARLYQEIGRSSKAKGVATEDYSLSRFIGLERAVGDNTKQFPGIVHMDKRRCTAMNQTFMNNLFKYLRSLSLAPAHERHICKMGCCKCKSGSSGRCGCNCQI